MRAIRGSELSDFLKDRFTWKLRWLDKLVPNKPQTALLTGTLIHKWLETYYATGNVPQADQAMQNLFNETDLSYMEQFESDEMWDLVMNLTKNYFYQWAEQDQNWKVIATELTFRIPLDEEITYTGTIDLLYLDENGNLWPCDHKSTKSIEGYEKNALLDRQISRYIWAVQQLVDGMGEIEKTYIDPFTKVETKKWIPVDYTALYSDIENKPVHGFLYNLILKEVPQPPKQLKKGGLSKDKSQHTTYDLYIQALNDAGITTIEKTDLGNWYIPSKDLVPWEYHEILQLLADQETEFGNRYFKRVPVFRLQAEVDASMQDFYAAAQDLVQLEKEIQAGDESRVYMNITKDTAYSAYQPIIAAVIEGSNVDLIKNNLYHIEEE